MTAPNGDLPGEGGYYADGSGTSSLTDYNTLDEAGAKARMKDGMSLPFDRLKGSFWGTIITGLDAVADAVGSVVGGFLGGIADVINGIASVLTNGLGEAAADHNLSEQRRVIGETAIKENWGDALGTLDESVRTGGAFSSYPLWRLEEGDNNWHLIPTSQPLWPSSGLVYDPVTGRDMMEGTSITYPESFDFGLLDKLSTNSAAVTLAEAANLGSTSRHLVLDEDGLWLVFFQASTRPFNSSWVGTTRPSLEVACFVTPATLPKVPVAPPDATSARAVWTDASDKGYTTVPIEDIQGFGRATGYATGAAPGGFTVFGMVPVILPSPGYKVNLACQQDWHYGGAASTYIWAFKVNTTKLRNDLEGLRDQLNAELPVPFASSSVDLNALVDMVNDTEAGLDGLSSGTGTPDWREEAPWELDD